MNLKTLRDAVVSLQLPEGSVKTQTIRSQDSQLLLQGFNPRPDTEQEG
jgi:hypothetical protein